MGDGGRARQARSLRLLPTLNTQAHAHLLANTLSLVSALARRRPEMAEDLLAYLAGYLRSYLAPRRPLVRLADELQTALVLVGIERARLGSRLRLQVRVAPDTLDARVPPLVLQPLVENAVRHGVARRRTGGCVCIAARVTADRLYVAVADDGPGLWRHTHRACAGHTGSARTGAAHGPGGRETITDAARGISMGGRGLACLRLRLDALWGTAARLRLLSRPGGGVLAVMSLPATPGPGAGARMSDEASGTPEASGTREASP